MTISTAPRRFHNNAMRIAWLLGSAGVLLAGSAAPAFAQGQNDRRAADSTANSAAPASAQLSYSELLELAEAAQIAVVVRIADQAVLKAERAPGLAPGRARLYLRADTESLLSGAGGVGQSLAFLVDRDLDARGRPPKLEKQRYLLFARTVPGRPAEIQLVRPTAMQPASPELLERARTVLRQIAEGPPLPQITGVREAISIPGNLAGESETQMFLETRDGAPVSLSVIRRPGMAPEWGVSWSEIVDQSAAAPQRETIAWARLTCSLPAELPAEAFLQDDPASRAQAREDYAFILDDLGPCENARA